MIEQQKTKPIVNIPHKKLFEVCLELNKLAFPISRRDDALFYIRPNMCIRQQDFGAIFQENGTPFGYRITDLTNTKIDWGKPRPALVDELIYVPTLDDLFKQTHGTVNQLTETLTSGWFAYTGVRPITTEQKPEDLLPDFIKGNGETPWFALADVWIQVQKWKLK